MFGPVGFIFLSFDLLETDYISILSPFLILWAESRGQKGQGSGRGGCGYVYGGSKRWRCLLVSPASFPFTSLIQSFLGPLCVRHEFREDTEILPCQSLTWCSCPLFLKRISVQTELYLEDRRTWVPKSFRNKAL